MGYIVAFPHDISRFLLAIFRNLCYAVDGATSSTPVGGSPGFLSGVNTYLCPQSKEGGGASRSESNKRLPVAIAPLFMAVMGVSWSELFQFCMVILTVIALVLQNNKEK